MWLVFALLFVPLCSGANILGLFTTSTKSHVIIHMGYAEALIAQGHNVTIVTTVPLKDKNPKYHHVLIPSEKDYKKKLEEGLTAVSNDPSPINTIKHDINNYITWTSNQYHAMRHEKLQSLLKDNKFDLMVLGYFFNDFQLAVAAQLKVPVIINWMQSPAIMLNTYVGNPTGLGYVPHMMVDAQQPMKFIERFGSILMDGLSYSIEKFLYYKFDQYYDEYVQEFNLKDMPSFDDMRKNVSLVFCNSHFSEGPIRPNVPAIVEIGGIQIKDKPDPLEPKLKEFLDNSSKHGAILFSMGSNVKVSTLDPKIIKTLYNVFSKLKQNVLWKWEDPNPASFPGNSKNILFSKWIPQDDVLAHKNMKLFVTHGGKGSVVESQYHGIPMIGLPVFGDQPGNIDKIVKVGYGLKLDYKTMTEQELSTAVNEVLNNPSYAANVKKFADTYKDRPLSARESVVFWTEYVIRHHGAPHLQSPLVHMNVIQQYSIDVLAVIFGALYIVYRISKLCICFVWRKVFGKKCKSKAKAKKSKKE
ncbi:hypothetical protein ACFFRR_010948 [Megaselia abdita]